MNEDHDDLRSQKFSKRSFVEFVRINDEQAHLKFPLEEKSISGSSVKTVENLWELFENNEKLGIDEIVDLMDISLKKAKGLVLLLLEQEAIKSEHKERNNYFDWISSESEKVRSNIQGSKIAVIDTDLGLKFEKFQNIDDVSIFETIKDLENSGNSYDIILSFTNGIKPNFHKNLLDYIWEEEINWIPARLLGRNILIGPLTKPGKGACHHCFYTRYMASQKNAKADIKEAKKREKNNNYPEYIFPAIELMKSVTALEATALLSQYNKPRTEEALLKLDFIDFQISKSDVIKIPQCKVCGTN
ncbi:MAG: TOMM precursor leader peptide-binding protein [Candidatus Paceibacteria bacterium]